MEAQEDWSSDTLDEIAAVAEMSGWADAHTDGMFREIREAAKPGDHATHLEERSC